MVSKNDGNQVTLYGGNQAILYGGSQATLYGNDGNQATLYGNQATLYGGPYFQCRRGAKSKGQKNPKTRQTCSKPSANLGNISIT